VWGRGFWCVQLKERDNLKDLGVGERKILKHTLKCTTRWCVLDLSASGERQEAEADHND